ncbi:MAG TPA: SwmB domain-containing protein [Gaiellaceae bacterium]|nr:SwmB domain-containing protein [Gaiellaceae bacterium]
MHVTTPASDGLRYRAGTLPGSLGGDSSDTPAGVTLVQVAVENGTGHYWNGTDFLATSPVWNSATGTGAWTYATSGLAGALSDGTYTISARGTDAAGNVSTPVTRTFVYDATAPTVSSRTVDGATVTVAYGETLDSGSAPSTTDFTVDVNGTPVAVDSLAFVSGDSAVALTLHTAARHADAVTVAYSGTALEDLAGNPAGTYSAQAATNQTADVAPSTPTLGSPGDAVYVGTATPTLHATFADPDTQDTGKVTFRICSDSNCDTVLQTLDSATNLAVGDTGSATAASLADGQYWWDAQDVDASAEPSSFSGTRSFTIDTSPPAASLVAPVALSGNQWFDAVGSVLWFNPNAGGSFQLRADASDAQSGIAQVAFPALLGTSANDQTTQTGGHYVSSTYTWTTSDGSQGAQTITASNGVTVPSAGTASTSIAVDADGAAPTTGALNNGALDGEIVSTGTTLSEQPDDNGGSGVASVAFFYCDVTASPGCTPNAQIGTTQTTPVSGIYSVSWDDSAIPDGDHAKVVATVTDNVGNSVDTAFATVTVDNSAPTVAFTNPTGLGSSAYWDSADKKLFLNATGSGTFTLHADASDSQSGISSVTFPALLGNSANAGTANGAPNYDSAVYSWSNPGSGSGSVSAANGIQEGTTHPLTSSDSLTIVPDGTAPTTSIQFPGDGDSYATSTLWDDGSATCTGSPSSGICGTVADGGSGVGAVTLTLEDDGTSQYYDGASFGSGAPVDLSATITGSDWAYALDHTQLTAQHQYTLTVHATDNVGNVESVQTLTFGYQLDITPPDVTLSLTSASHAYLAADGADAWKLYYGTLNGGGSFTLQADVTDSSGLASVVFPDVHATSGFSGDGGPAQGATSSPYTGTRDYSFTSGATTPPSPNPSLTATDNPSTAHNTSTQTIQFVLDDTAPSGGTLVVNGTTADQSGTTASYLTSGGAVDVAASDYTDTGSGLLSSTLDVQHAALSGNACGGYTDDGPIPTATTTYAVANGTCYRFTLTGTDRVGNTVSISTTVEVDTTAPLTPTISFPSHTPSANTFANGSTLFYKPVDGGSFTVSADGSTDPETGIASYAFSGPSTGFVGTPSQNGNQLTVDFDHTSTGSGTFDVHSTNGASVDSPDASFTLTPDSTAPTGGALTVNGVAADGSAGGTTSWLDSGTQIAIGARTDFTDGGSGLASSTLTYATEQLQSGSCIGSWGTPQTVTGTNPVTFTTGNCYQFTLTGTDNVGNVATLRTVVMVDTSAPGTGSDAALSAAISNVTGAAYLQGSTLWFRPAGGGGFRVTANNGNDSQSGLKAGNAGYSFSDLTAKGFGITQTGNVLDVTFDGSSQDAGSQSVVTNDNAGLSSSPATYTVSADTSAPTGGAISGPSVTDQRTFSLNVTKFTDSGSGVATGTNTLSYSAPQAASGGICPSSGYDTSSPTGVSLPVGQPTANPNVTVPADGCYQFTLAAPDRVGNTAATTLVVNVDTSGATGGSIAYADGVTTLDTVDITWDAGSDTDSGITNVQILRATATLTDGTCSGFTGFTSIATNPSANPFQDTLDPGTCYQYELLVQNGAGVQSTFTSASVVQATNAGPISLATAPSDTYFDGNTLWLGATGGSFSLQLTTDGANGVTDATWQGAAPLDATPTAGAGDSFVSPDYTWADDASFTSQVQVTRNPGADVDSIAVATDTDAPQGSIDYADGHYVSPSVPVSIDSETDNGGSGVATTTIMRQQTTLVGDTCNTGGWSGFTTTVTLSSGNDTSVQSGHCYQYEAVVTDHVGNSDTFTSAAVAKINDTVAPTLVTASTNAAGSTMTLSFSEPLENAATTPASAFTVFFNGAAQPTPTGITIDGDNSKVLLSLATAPNDGQTVTVSYAKPSTAGDRLRDQALGSENEVASFSSHAVTNGTTDTTAPTLVSATVNGSALALTFTETVTGGPDLAAFVVSVDSVAVPVSSLTISGKVVTLTLASPVTSGNAVTVAYDHTQAGASPLADAHSNDVADFAQPVGNNTPAPSSGSSGGGSPGPSSSPSPTPTTPTPTTPTPAPPTPVLVSTSPPDGTTFDSVAQFSATANTSATWTAQLTDPAGVTTTLATQDGTSATWNISAAADGLYVVTGTIGNASGTTSWVSHFTVYTAPPPPAPGQTTPPAPAVQKNATPDAGDTAVTADKSVTFSWPAATFGSPVVVQVKPTEAISLPSLPPDSIVVDVKAFDADTGKPITDLGAVADIQFANAPDDAQPVTSEDGTTFHEIPGPLASPFTLPDGQDDGWYRDSKGVLHVLTRHLSYYALVVGAAPTPLAVEVVGPKRTWLRKGALVARISLTTQARVTTWFTHYGTVVKGSMSHPKGRNAGGTNTRISLAAIKRPGVYVLHVHADGESQTADAITALRVLAKAPANRLGGLRKPFRVGIVTGFRGTTAVSLTHALGSSYPVDRVALTAVYDAADPHRAKADAALVAYGNSAAMFALLGGVHKVLPETPIVTVTTTAAGASYAKSLGLIPVSSRAGSKAIAAAIEAALHAKPVVTKPVTSPKPKHSPKPTTPTPPTTTPTPPATGNPIAWPNGKTGFTVVLQSLPVGAGQAAATAAAKAAIAKGLPQVGTLVSSAYSSLTPGYYVVFSGVYSTLAQAQAAAANARAHGYAGAYSRTIK